MTEMADRPSTVSAASPAKWTARDQFALQLLAPLFAGGRLWPVTAWSLRPAAILDVANDLVVHDRRLVLELGAGLSTLLFARVLADHGDRGRLIAVESDGGYAAAVNRELGVRGLETRARVVSAPLGADGDWYERAAVLEALGDERPDVLVVDGPPGDGGPDARRPALEVLGARLDSRATILLDDTQRPAEAGQLLEWAAAFPGHRFKVVDGTYAVGRPDGMWHTTV